MELPPEHFLDSLDIWMPGAGLRLSSKHLGGVMHGMYLRGLGSREYRPPMENPDIHLARSSQGEGSSGQRCSGDGCRCGEAGSGV